MSDLYYDLKLVFHKLKRSFWDALNPISNPIYYFNNPTTSCTAPNTNHLKVHRNADESSLSNLSKINSNFS